MNVLTTNGLSKAYKGHLAVNQVSMHIEKGDIYGFVGENGAGKTTLIRLVTGLSAPTAGTYALFDVPNDSKEIYAARRRTGAIVETATMSRGMTALENLKVQCNITDVTRTDAELIELIGRVGLDYEAIRGKKVGNFSLGMRQRLGIAMVMVSDADFVILDEPMNGLDPQGFIEVRETIQKLNREGVTFLVSSHILAELDKICNKIGVISHGELLEEISMEDLHQKARRRVVIDAETPIAAWQALKADGSFPEMEAVEGKIVIYGSADLNRILRILVEQGQNVRSLNTLEETIEDHYIRLLGRGKIV
ncbi:MAG: ATP-binding cassette domain-containing protein [Lachnospiraceae bacterium]|nr:ATP-binding cassette domain-containing protein [Lachnospiraceae bacterium]